MSSNSQVLNTGQQATTNYSTSKLIIGDNEFEQATYTNNDSYDDLELSEGLVLGRIAADNEVTAMTSGASDGSQFPIGVLFGDVTIPAGESATVTMVTSGRINENSISLSGSDTLATVVSDKTIRDRIGSDSIGLVLVGSEDLTNYDNN